MDASHGSPSSSSLQIVNCLRRQDRQCLNLVELSACVSWTEVRDKKKRRRRRKKGLLSSGWWWTNAERSPHCCFNSVLYSLQFIRSLTHPTTVDWTGSGQALHCTLILHHLSLLFVIYFPHKKLRLFFSSTAHSLLLFVCATWKGKGKTDWAPPAFLLLY